MQTNYDRPGHYVAKRRQQQRLQPAIKHGVLSGLKFAEDGEVVTDLYGKLNIPTAGGRLKYLGKLSGCSDGTIRNRMIDYHMVNRVFESGADGYEYAAARNQRMLLEEHAELPDDEKIDLLTPVYG